MTREVLLDIAQYLEMRSDLVCHDFEKFIYADDPDYFYDDDSDIEDNIFYECNNYDSIRHYLIPENEMRIKIRDQHSRL